MPSLGPAEILVVLVIALLVFGPDKMPDMARQAGRAFREFRRVQQHVRSEIHGAIGDLDGTTSAGPTMSNGPTPTPQGDPVPTLPPLDTSASSTPNVADSSPGAPEAPAAEGSAGNPPPSSPPADPA